MPAGAYFLDLPQIIWPGGTLQLGGPLDGALAYAVPRAGGEVVDFPSGESDGWDAGLEYFLEGLADYLPPTTQLVHGVNVTGWDGPAGWRAYLEWAWDGETHLWRPASTEPGTTFDVVLDAPGLEAFPAAEADGTRQLLVRYRSAARVPFLGY